jgi:hypothetical protein
MKHNIKNLRIKTLSITALSIIKHRLRTLGIAILSMMVHHNVNQHRSTQYNYTSK